MQRFVRFMMWRAVLRMEIAELVLPPDEGDAGGRRISARRRARHPAGTRSNWKQGHVVCIFPEGAITPYGQPAAVQARLRKDRRGPGCARDSGPPGRRLGQHFQLLRRPLLPEVAAARALSCDGFVRQADAGWRNSRTRRGRPCRNSAAQAIEHAQDRGGDAAARFIASARENWSRFAMADSTGRELTYGRALTAACWSRAGRAGTAAPRRWSACCCRRPSRSAGQHRRHDRGQGSGESEFHGRQGSAWNRRRSNARSAPS